MGHCSALIFSFLDTPSSSSLISAKSKAPTRYSPPVSLLHVQVPPLLLLSFGTYPRESLCSLFYAKEALWALRQAISRTYA